VMHFTYDEAHRRLTTRDTLPAKDSVAYDPAGNVTSTTSRRGYQTTQEYDALNRLVTRRTGAVIYPSDAASQARKFPYFGSGGFVYDPLFDPTATPPDLVVRGDT